MQPCTLLTTASLFAATTKSECYNRGELWAEQSLDANWVVVGMCIPNLMSGYFDQDQTKYQCIELIDGKKGEFWVQWRGEGGWTLDDGDCISGLANEVNGCDRGGESVHSDWYFRSDPNAGGC